MRWSGYARWPRGVSASTVRPRNDARRANRLDRWLGRYLIFSPCMQAMPHCANTSQRRQLAKPVLKGRHTLLNWQKRRKLLTVVSPERSAITKYLSHRRLRNLQAERCRALETALQGRVEEVTALKAALERARVELVSTRTKLGRGHYYIPCAMRLFTCCRQLCRPQERTQSAVCARFACHCGLLHCVFRRDLRGCAARRDGDDADGLRKEAT